MKLTGWQKTVIAVAAIGAALVVGGWLSGADWAGLMRALVAGAGGGS